jgi:phosphate transport system substrate-binding protein
MFDLLKGSRFGASLVAALVAVSITVAGVAAQDATPIPYTPGTDPETLSGTIVADGSSTVGPVTEAIAEEFVGIAPDVQVEISISGSGGGFSRFCNGETDLQNASRHISDSEIEGCAEAGVDFYEFEAAYDGLAVVVNPDNDWVDCLTVDQLNTIWGPDSTVNTWSEVDPEFPDEPLSLYGPGTASGTYDYFTEVVTGEAGVSRTDYTPSEDDNVLVEGVAGDRGALGFFGLAYFEQNADRLKLVSIDGGEGCVEPTPETVSGGEYSPLSRPLFVYVAAESLTRPEVQEFMRFYLAEVNTLIEDVGYVEAPIAELLAAQEKLEAAIEGTGTPDSQIEG